MKDTSSTLSSRLFFGGVLVILGLSFLLENFGAFQASSLLHNWWPMFIILFGFAQVVANPKSYLGAGIIVLVGILLELSVLNVLQFNVWSLFFPVVLVLIGLRVMLGTASEKLQDASKTDYANATASFGSSVVRNASDTYKGGLINVVFGGAKLDLRDAELDEKGAVIEVNVAFGGADIIVPTSWNVVTEGLPIFGGWENKTEGPSSGPVLKVKGVILFGGVTIKNVDDNK